MTRAEYEQKVCARCQDAIRVPFRRVPIGDWSPKASECHQNVDRWVEAHPEDKAVRGWVTYASFGNAGAGLTAHSIVLGSDAVLFDITPLGNESVRAGMRFVEHEGDEETFFAMKAIDLNIHCFYLSGCEVVYLEPAVPEMSDDE